VSRERLLASAESFLGIGEEPKGSNRSGWIDAMNAAVDADLGSPWCASFIAHCLDDSIGVYETLPFKRTASVQEMVDDAKARGLFTKDPSIVLPGDLVVYFYEGLHRYGHIGIVKTIHLAEDADDVTTTVSIDGNTIPDDSGDSREGFGVFEKVRTVGPHTAFLTWESA
jgi:hypothetical protein